MGIKGPEDFLFPVKALSKVFRGKFIDLLKKAFTKGKLAFPGKTEPIGTQKSFSHLINQLWEKDWVVYSKKPFAGPEWVLSDGLAHSSSLKNTIYNPHIYC